MVTDSILCFPSNVHILVALDATIYALPIVEFMNYVKIQPSNLDTQINDTYKYK